MFNIEMRMTHIISLGFYEWKSSRTSKCFIQISKSLFRSSGAICGQNLGRILESIKMYKSGFQKVQQNIRIYDGLRFCESKHSWGVIDDRRDYQLGRMLYTWFQCPDKEDFACLASTGNLGKHEVTHVGLNLEGVNWSNPEKDHSSQDVTLLTSRTSVIYLYVSSTGKLLGGAEGTQYLSNKKVFKNWNILRKVSMYRNFIMRALKMLFSLDKVFGWKRKYMNHFLQLHVLFVSRSFIFMSGNM